MYSEKHLEKPQLASSQPPPQSAQTQQSTSQQSPSNQNPSSHHHQHHHPPHHHHHHHQQQHPSSQLSPQQQPPPPTTHHHHHPHSIHHQQQQQQPHQQHHLHPHHHHHHHPHSHQQNHHHQHPHHHHQQQQQTQQQQQQQQQHSQHQQPQPQQQQQQQQQHQQQQQSTMFTRFDANKSTKGASKLRRDLINAEIANLRDLLPLPQSTRQRLSQLQLMALVCVYVRKANYFQQVFKRHDIAMHHAPTPNIGFSKALSGFLMMLTQNGKLLYISDNAAEYLGHSMEDLLIHGDSVYDIIDKQDHGPIQAELNRNIPQQSGGALTGGGQHNSTQSNLEGEHRMFLCRMNVSRNARRQMRFGDQKVVLVQGHYLSFLPLCSRNEPVFLATCTPIAMPETRECVVQGATNVFTTIHSMDMKIVHIDKIGEFHLGFNKNELQGLSWYNFLHWDSLREAQNKHRLITTSEQDRSCILLIRMQRRQGDFIWIHAVLQVRDSQDSNQQPSVIVCTNQVLNEREASVMLANSWLYHYYSVQSKIQFGLPFEGPTRVPPTPSYYHHHHHHHSPTIPPNLAHGYPPHPHHVPYGYHSPVGLAPPPPPPPSHHHQTSPSHIMGHHHHHHHNGTNGSNGMVGPYPYRIEIQQPVDYSQQTTVTTVTTSPQSIEPRCSSTNSSNSGSNRLGPSPPPPKRRIFSKIEPLYIGENSQPGSETTIIEPESQFYQTNMVDGNGGGGIESENSSVTYGTVIPTRPRIITKAPPPDPPDFIDLWNPSPPWSEGTQKVPDISQQELSPYLTTTPPTPTSAPPSVQSIGPAFSFDWMSEQFVPIMDYGHCVPCVAQDGSISVQVPVQLPHHWPPDPRLITTLQTHTNNSQTTNTLIPTTVIETTTKSNENDENGKTAPPL